MDGEQVGPTTGYGDIDIDDSARGDRLVPKDNVRPRPSA
jgi:hypothetical protein